MAVNSDSPGMIPFANVVVSDPEGWEPACGRSFHLRTPVQLGLIDKDFVHAPSPTLRLPSNERRSRDQPDRWR